jgi:N-acetylmuramoyl-L-alanine amidase
MKKLSLIATGAVALAMVSTAVPVMSAAEVEGWGDFKLFLDPGHSGHENQGLWGYSEAEKTLQVALNIKDMLERYTDIPAENLKLCRYTESETVELEERSDAANAWGADFFYAIHSDASSTKNTTVTLFGGWRKDGVDIEKTPNGGKAYGEILNPNLTGVMRITTRGNYYDRCYYDPTPATHTNQYPYLSVNRRTNMPSLLSEGGYHTLAEQQQRNLNAEYRRLEAFAAFQSILQYRGLNRPAQTFLHGAITNSENGQPINGATAKIGDQVYTTDTWEGLFQKYTKNENLIHNGLYTFEGLEAGKEYEVEFSAPGFESKTEKVTIKAGGDQSADYVTYLDVALTNTAPAKVDAISIEDASSVSPLYPMVITFSRNMDKESVEQAFSIDNGGQVTLSWDNDYTLSVDLSQLDALWDYTIKIDGSVAKNSQTGQFLDGDGDGEAGGDYVYKFTMAEPDTEAPEVVSTYPAAEGEALHAFRLPIRIEYNEILNWNDDKNSDCITVKSASGKVYSGKTTHTEINGRSVLHFYPSEDFAKDEAVLVTVAAGLADLSGNTTTSDYSFRFLTEYRNITSEEEVLNLSTTGNFWAPSGSGSTKGLTDEGNETTTMAVAPTSDGTTSMSMKYSFDEAYAENYWYIRLYTKDTNNTVHNDFDGVLSAWVYGDGSNNAMNVNVRVESAGGGLKYRDPNLTIDFRGWNLYTWDFQNDGYKDFTGTQELKTKMWRFDSFSLLHEYTDPDDEDVPYQEWSGEIAFSTLKYTKWDNNAERQAQLSDVELPENGVQDAVADALRVNVGVNTVTIIGAEDIVSANVYAVDGSLVAVAKGHGNIATVSTASLPAGVYVVKAATASKTQTVKFVK